MRAYDVRNDALIWTGPTLGSGRDIAIAELDGGGRPELVVAAADRLRVYSRDGQPSFAEAAITAGALSDLRDLEVGDVDGDGVVELFALHDSPARVRRFDASLAAVDPDSGEEIWQSPTEESRAHRYADRLDRARRRALRRPRRQRRAPDQGCTSLGMYLTR